MQKLEQKFFFNVIKNSSCQNATMLFQYFIPQFGPASNRDKTLHLNRFREIR